MVALPQWGVKARTYPASRKRASTLSRAQVSTRGTPTRHINTIRYAVPSLNLRQLQRVCDLSDWRSLGHALQDYVLVKDKLDGMQGQVPVDQTHRPNSVV